MKSTAHDAGSLRLRIAELEERAFQQKQDLKSTAHDIVEGLKPANLIKGAFSSTVKSPGFSKNLLKGALGLAAGFLSKKIFVMGSSSTVKKALGTVVELGVAKVVANNAAKITAGGIKMLSKANK
jgi:hypothetical protein